jgi:hypothetical protein
VRDYKVSDDLQVIVGYALELVLGVTLSVALISQHLGKQKSSRVKAVVSRSFDTYADAAVLLTFSIQLASLVILVRKDFGISATDFGALTVEVTWAAALLTMLPITFLCYIYEDVPKKASQLEDPRDLRLIVILVSWAMFLYTFFSRMIANYGPSQIGVSRPGKPPFVLNPTEEGNIEVLCYQGQEGLSASENTAFEFFAIGGSLFVSITIIGALFWTLAARSRSSRLRFVRDFSNPAWLSPATARLLLVACVVLWSVPQLWAIVRFRSMQQALASSIRSFDYDNIWSFGQIIAVTVFLPVFVEVIFTYAKWEPDSSTRHDSDKSEMERK